MAHSADDRPSHPRRVPVPPRPVVSRHWEPPRPLRRMPDKEEAWVVSEEGSLAPIEEIYAERNAAALAFANLAVLAGWNVGCLTDDPEWPVVLVDTPHGQVSWHVSAAELPDGFPPYPGEWDGHTTAEKNRRLHRFIHLGERGRADDARDAA